MALKNIAILVLTIALCISFCGCGFADNTDDMVAPPELTGEMAPIAQALYNSAGSSYDLTYPTAGDHRSAIVLEDIDSNGNFEAFAFYSTSDDEMTTMHINVICQQDGEWSSVSDQTIVATGVEMIDFCDLNSNGTQEVLVGWQVNGTSEKQLTVFSYENGTLTQRLSQPYTSFFCYDLDSNGSNEIFVHLLMPTEKTNKAMVYNYNDNGMAQTTGCVMDGNVKSAASPVLSTLSNGQTAIYIDEIKGVGSVTEVLCFLKGELINPLLNVEASYENTLTLRAAALETKDINDDGILEIPVASELPNAAGDGEKLYYTNWCSFNGEKLTVKLTTVVNTVDGYYLVVPSNMLKQISVLKDIEKHERKFYRYDSRTQTSSEEIFTLTAISVEKWDDQNFDRGSMVEITRTKSTVFVVELGEGAAAFSISVDLIKSIFRIVD